MIASRHTICIDSCCSRRNKDGFWTFPYQRRTVILALLLVLLNIEEALWERVYVAEWKAQDLTMPHFPVSSFPFPFHLNTLSRTYRSRLRFLIFIPSFLLCCSDPLIYSHRHSLKNPEILASDSYLVQPAATASYQHYLVNT